MRGTDTNLYHHFVVSNGFYFYLDPTGSVRSVFHPRFMTLDEAEKICEKMVKSGYTTVMVCRRIETYTQPEEYKVIVH